MSAEAMQSSPPKKDDPELAKIASEFEAIQQDMVEPEEPPLKSASASTTPATAATATVTGPKFGLLSTIFARPTAEQKAKQMDDLVAECETLLREMGFEVQPGVVRHLLSKHKSKQGVIDAVLKLKQETANPKDPPGQVYMLSLYDTAQKSQPKASKSGSASPLSSSPPGNNGPAPVALSKRLFALLSSQAPAAQPPPPPPPSGAITPVSAPLPLVPVQKP
jgi:hypothetical protein